MTRDALRFAGSLVLALRARLANAEATFATAAPGDEAHQAMLALTATRNAYVVALEEHFEASNELLGIKAKGRAA